MDVNSYFKSHMVVFDGRTAGMGGELGANRRDLNVIIFSEDLVAADAVGARYLGYNSLCIGHLKLAQERGLGVADLNKIEILEVE